MNGTRPEQYAQRIQRACDYIYQHLDADLSLEHMSKVACFSKFHFHRQFVEFTGLTTARFIQLMRLRRASYRLAFEKDNKIIDIALEAQFENPESFSRAFKSTFGQTPSQFRERPEWPQWHSRYQFTRPNTEGEHHMEIKIVDFKPTRVAVLEHRGDPQWLNESIGRFIEWRKQSQLSPVHSSQTYGISYDDPRTTDPQAYRYDICGSIEADIPDNPQGVKASVIPGGRCAVIRHHGSNEDMGESIAYLYRQWLPESGEELRDYPLFFHFLKLIPFVEEHEQQTDIYLPLQ